MLMTCATVTYLQCISRQCPAPQSRVICSTRAATTHLATQERELVAVGRGLHDTARSDGIMAAHVDDGDRLRKRLGFLDGGGERTAHLIGCSAGIERNDQLDGLFGPLRMSETGAGQQPDGGNREKSFHVIPLFFARSNVLVRRLLV